MRETTIRVMHFGRAPAMIPNPVLDNIFWHALVGPHAKYASGTDDVRRYAVGFSPMIGFADPGAPNLRALRPYCEAGEHFYAAGWSGPAPADWHVEFESTMFRMVWAAPMPAADGAPDA